MAGARLIEAGKIAFFSLLLPEKGRLRTPRGLIDKLQGLML
jgi:hypothetical protein